MRTDALARLAGSRAEIAGLLLLGLGGPFFFFPELIPASARVVAVGLATATALLVAITLLHDDLPLRVLAGVLAVTAVFSWLLAPQSRTAISHFSGFGIGLLAMSVVRSWCRTEGRLLAVALLFVLVGTSVVVLALAGTWVRLVGPEIRPRVFPIQFNWWLPYIGLDQVLPGIVKGAGVNKNALGALTLLVVPMAAALAMLARGTRLMLAARVLAAAAFVAGFYVFVVAESRAVWIAGGVIAGIASLRLLRGRWRVAAVVMLLGLPAVAAAGLWVSDSTTFAEYVDRMQSGTDSREDIWAQAFDRLNGSYGLGIGFSQFRQVRATTDVEVSEFKPVAHAHNIFLQTALDLGIAGMVAYAALMGVVVFRADRVARGGRAVAARVAAGGGLVIIAVHVFGLGDAVALGARIGIFQWLAAGLVLAAWTTEAGHLSRGAHSNVSQFS